MRTSDIGVYVIARLDGLTRQERINWAASGIISVVFAAIILNIFWGTALYFTVRGGQPILHLCFMQGMFMGFFYPYWAKLIRLFWKVIIDS